MQSFILHYFSFQFFAMFDILHRCLRPSCQIGPNLIHIKYCFLQFSQVWISVEHLRPHRSFQALQFVRYEDICPGQILPNQKISTVLVLI